MSLPPAAAVVQPPSLTVVQPPSLTVVQPPSLTVAQPPSLTVAQPPAPAVAQPPSLTVAQPPNLTVAQPPNLTVAQPPASVAPLPAAVPIPQAIVQVPQAIVAPVIPTATAVIPVATPVAAVMEPSLPTVGTSAAAMRPYRPHKSLVSTWGWLAVLLVVGTGIWQYFRLSGQALKILPLESYAGNELQPIQFQAKLATRNVNDDAWVFSLVQAPAGATIDPHAGVFQWTPQEADGPAHHQVVIRLQLRDHPEVFDQTTVPITIHEVNEPPVLEPIPVQVVEPGGMVLFQAVAHDADLPANKLRFSLGPRAPAGVKIDPVQGIVRWTVPARAAGTTEHQFQVIVKDAEPGGASAAQVARVRVTATAPTSLPETRPAAATPPVALRTPPRVTEEPVTEEMEEPAGGARTAAAPPRLDSAEGMSDVARKFVAAGSGKVIHSFVSQANQQGLSARVDGSEKIPGLRGQATRILLGQETLRVVEYHSPADAAAEAARFSADGTKFDNRSLPWTTPMSVTARDRLIVLYAGSDAKVLSFLKGANGPSASAPPAAPEAGMSETP